jgi:hypothetical protein
MTSNLVQLNSTAKARRCGWCTACCEALPVEDLNKAPRMRCRHQCDWGCAVYKDRPSDCREYRCDWLSGVSGILRDDERPDLIGVIVETFWFFSPSMNDRVNCLMIISCGDPSQETITDLMTRGVDAGYLVICEGVVADTDDHRRADALAAFLAGCAASGQITIQGPSTTKTYKPSDLAGEYR